MDGRSSSARGRRATGVAGHGTVKHGVAGYGGGTGGRHDGGGTGGRRDGAATRLVTLAAGLAAALMVAAARPVATADSRIDGEHGLWVHATADSVRVQWLMGTPRAGWLLVQHEDSSETRHETAVGATHAVTFARPAGDRFTLRYGAADHDAPVHETFIDLAAPNRPPVEFDAVDSLYILGDTHGSYDALVAGLRGAGLIDERLAWSGGTKHLVFAGDLVDRGPDVLQLLWFVYRLEREAARAGGRVHVLLGNHEIMVMLGDLRYVHPKEQLVADLHGVAYDRLFDVRRSVLGRWLASKPAAIRVGTVLVSHGGLRPEHVQPSLRALDDTLRTYVGEELFYLWADSTAAPIAMDSATYQRREDFFFGTRSVFWHRAYIQGDETAAADLDQLLRQQNAEVLVVGHTAVPRIEALFDGRLIAAHTPRFGAELVLLVREESGLRRFRVAGRTHEEF
jgi:hypothetical protein